MSRIDQVLSAVGAMAILLSAAGCATGPSKSEKAAAPPAPPPKISMLYATPNVVENGESSQLCYSVEDTTKVTLDPPVDRVWPALSRCLEIKPVKTTTYTLTAENAARAWVTASSVPLSWAA